MIAHLQVAIVVEVHLTIEAVDDGLWDPAHQLQGIIIHLRRLSQLHREQTKQGRRQRTGLAVADRCHQLSDLFRSILTDPCDGLHELPSHGLVAHHAPHAMTVDPEYLADPADVHTTRIMLIKKFLYQLALDVGCIIISIDADQLLADPLEAVAQLSDGRLEPGGLLELTLQRLQHQARFMWLVLGDQVQLTGALGGGCRSPVTQLN